MTKDIPAFVKDDEQLLIGFRHARGKPIDKCVGVQNAVDLIERWVGERIEDATTQMYLRDLNFGRYFVGYWPKGQAKKFVLVGTLMVGRDTSAPSNMRCTWTLAEPPLPKMPALPTPDCEITTEDDGDSAEDDSGS